MRTTQQVIDEPRAGDSARLRGGPRGYIVSATSQWARQSSVRVAFRDGSEHLTTLGVWQSEYTDHVGAYEDGNAASYPALRTLVDKWKAEAAELESSTEELDIGREGALLDCAVDLFSVLP
jgi:hypothetical protein